MATPKKKPTAPPDEQLLAVPITTSAIHQRFSLQPSTEEGRLNHERILRGAAGLAQLIHDNCPGNDAAAIAKNKLQEAVFWAQHSVNMRP